MMRSSVFLIISMLLVVPLESSFAGPMMGGSVMMGGPIQMNQKPSVNQQHMIVLGTNIYMVWTLSIPTGGDQIIFKKSIDGGKTFENQIQLGNDTAAGEPSIAVNSNDVYVAWSSQFNGSSKIIVRHSSDGGTSFQQVSPDVGKITDINLAAIEASENLVQLVWTGSLGPNRTQVVALSQSTNGGNSFEGPTYISDPNISSYSPLVSHTASNTFIEWNSQGQNPCTPIYEACQVSHFFRPIINGALGNIVHLSSIDGEIPIRITSDQNTIFVEGLKRNYQNGFFQNSTVTISKSTDAGHSFSSTLLYSIANMADISLVISEGTVYQFWTVYDNGFAPAPIFAEKSTDAGKTFGSPVNVSGKTTPVSVDLSNQVISSGGNVFAVWPGTDESGADHVFFAKMDPTLSSNVRIIEDLPQAGTFHVGAHDSTVYVSYLVNGNLIFGKIDDSSNTTTDFTCSINQNPPKESITTDTPQILIDGNPVQNMLAGWKSQVKSSLQNTQDQDLKIVYQVQALRDRAVLWKQQENVTLLCGKSSDAKINWSPQSSGNYTIQTSLLNPSSSSPILSSNSTVTVSENSDLQTFSSTSPVQFKILNQTRQLNQEGFAKFLLQAGPSSQNYRLGSVSLSIDSPQGVQAWFDQYSIYSFDNKPQNLTMYVYADSSAKPDLNALKIEGKGTVENLVTGEYFNVGNPIPPDEGTLPSAQSVAAAQQQGYQQIDTVNITVMPAVPKPTSYLTVGPPTIHPVHFCSTPNGPGGGQMCMGFVGYEEFPLEVYADKSQKVTLNAKNFPDGGWFKFQPQELVATPQGAPSKLIIASVIKPFMINVLSVQVMRIYSNSSNSASLAYLPLDQGSKQLKVLNTRGAIEFGSLTTNINSTTPDSFGVVYDSNQSTASLPVSLSILGIIKGDKILPMPSWLSINFSPATFTLNSSQPYYFEIETSTTAPPAGSNETVAVGEEIGGQNYTGHIQISIEQPAYMGPMGAPGSPVTTPHLPPLKLVENGTSIKDIVCNQGLELVEKKEDNSPACVKPTTKSALLERGWAILVQ